MTRHAPTGEGQEPKAKTQKVVHGVLSPHFEYASDNRFQKDGTQIGR